MRSKLQLFLILVFVIALALPARADVSLPAIVDSKMVLQSGTKAPIWGWAEPGEVVTVSFAGQTKKTTAAANGKWMIKLDPLAVSAQPRTMAIQANNEITLNDVLVGEVWLASGQSNMEFSIGGIVAEEKALAAAEIDNKLLRMFCHGPKVSSALPLPDGAGYWSDCSYFVEQMQAGNIRVYDSHSAVAFFFGLKLQQELQVPVAVIDSSWGGTKIESWIADEGYEMEALALRKVSAKDEATAIAQRDELAAKIQKWRAAARESLESHKFVSPNLKTPQSRGSNGIYNGMVAPLVPFSIKGVVWYQGESNNRSKDYFQKLKALTGGWSKVFDVPDIPFYLVQMAPYNYAHSKTKNISQQSIYDSVVNAQYKAAKEIKGCDVITIPDTVFGNVNNVHPPHKKTAGDRLAALALHHDYGKPIICSGPRFETASAKAGSVTVTFDRIDQGLETADGEAPNWFEVAGVDKKFVGADATIKGDTVIASSPEVPEPMYIRMAWNNIAEQNLRDKNGWPAFSFNADVSQEAKKINPYAVTANKVTLAEPAVLKLDPDVINMLAPSLGELSPDIQPVVKNYMVLWCEAKKDGPCQIQWTVQAPADGKYEVSASVEGKGSRLVASCNDQQQEATVTQNGWHRLVLGSLNLKAGQNKVRLEIDSVSVTTGNRTKRFLISAIELAQPAAKEAIVKEAAAGQQQPDWFKDAGYGLMFQWTNRATPVKGPIKPWEEKVNDFDLDQFIQLVDDSGASYVIWSVTWGNQYISAPVKSLDKIISGRTTSRDLLGEMADRLREKDVKLIFYYHYGYECYHSQDKAWLEAAGGHQADKSQLYENLQGILTELGDRYGDKLDGWWFDGGARYLNCHFDGSSGAEGILTAPLKSITAAARSGNPTRMVAYNSWIKPKITRFQDYYGGEGRTGFSPRELSDGIFKSGRQQGLQAHGCFILEKRWGHIDLNTPIAKPKYSLEQLTRLVKRSRQARYPLSINLEMYEDGSVSPASAALLKELKAAVGKK